MHAAAHIESGLALTIGANEVIKGIRETSSAIDLAAVNAMLTARQAGDAVSGYIVVSRELRGFSARLNTLMGHLAGQIREMVRLSADHSRQTHMQAFHAACADKSARAGQYLAEARSTKARVVSETERAILRARKALGMGLVESERLCLLGLGMARAARIEAVHGGRHASMLTQVASELEQAVGEIRERVGLLRRQFRDGTAHPPAAPARSLSAVPAASVPVPRVPECV